MKQLLLALFAIAAGCQESSEDSGASPSGSSPAPVPGGGVTTQVYVESSAEIMNPERGFFSGVDLINSRSYSHVRAAGYTIAMAHPLLRDYVNGPLPQSFLDKLEGGLQALRAHRIKIVLRFRYDEGATYPSPAPDAPLLIALNHIEQLGPYVRNYSDVIAVIQAGFIGAWGEWHTSLNLGTAEARRAILLKELEEFPVSRNVQVRSPRYVQEIFGPTPLSAAEAYTGTPKSRTGFYNDCFLGSSTDKGTYTPGDVELNKQFTEAFTLYTSTSGET